MNREVEEAVDAMSPADLAALEGELDKRAAESEHARLFAMGRKMAQDAVTEYQKTGSLPPVLALLKGAADASEANAVVDAELSKMSEGELADLEADLDKAAQEKLSAEYAAEYFKIGQEMAREYAAGLKKEGARVAPGLMGTLGTAFGNFAKKSPLGAAAAAAGVGAVAGPAVGRILNPDRR